ncbi:hypothetical protein Hanom_Chr15g01337151 [Helianthus anomalus]
MENLLCITPLVLQDILYSMLWVGRWGWVNYDINCATRVARLWVGLCYCILFFDLLGSEGRAGVIRGWRVEPSSRFSGCYLVDCFSCLFFWTIGSLSLFSPCVICIITKRSSFGGLGLVCVRGMHTSPGVIRLERLGEMSFRWYPFLIPIPKSDPLNLCFWPPNCLLVFCFIRGSWGILGWDRFHKKTSGEKPGLHVLSSIVAMPLAWTMCQVLGPIALWSAVTKNWLHLLMHHNRLVKFQLCIRHNFHLLLQVKAILQGTGVYYLGKLMLQRLLISSDYIRMGADVHNRSLKTGALQNDNPTPLRLHISVGFVHNTAARVNHLFLLRAFSCYWADLGGILGKSHEVIGCKCNRYSDLLSAARVPRPWDGFLNVECDCWWDLWASGVLSKFLNLFCGHRLLKLVFSASWAACYQALPTGLLMGHASYKKYMGLACNWVCWMKPSTGCFALWQFSGTSQIVCHGRWSVSVKWAHLVTMIVGLSSWLVGQVLIGVLKAHDGLLDTSRVCMVWVDHCIFGFVRCHTLRWIMPRFFRHFCKSVNQKGLDPIASVMYVNTRYFCTPKQGRMISYFWSPKHVSGMLRGYAPLKL